MRTSYELVSLALTTEPVISEAGLPCSSHKALADIDPAELDALIVPGGDMVRLKDAEPLFLLVSQISERHALLAAICSGPYVLARAGVLTGATYTITEY